VTCRHAAEQVKAFHRHEQNIVARLPRRRLRANKDYLSTVTNADLNHVLNEPQYSPLPTLSIRFASVINCNTRHAGQIEYLRGLEPENLLPYLRGASSQASSFPLSAVRNP